MLAKATTAIATSSFKTNDVKKYLRLSFSLEKREVGGRVVYNWLVKRGVREMTKPNLTRLPFGLATWLFNFMVISAI